MFILKMGGTYFVQANSERVVDYNHEENVRNTN